MLGLGRLVPEIAGDQVSRRRGFAPFSVEGVEERKVNLVEDLIARPGEVNAELGDEPFPIDLAAYSSPGVAGLVALVCCRMIETALMIWPVSIGRS